MAEAESRFRTALAFRAEVIHVDHPDTAEILEHLAALLRKTGRGGEAKTIEVQAKAMLEQDGPKGSGKVTTRVEENRPGE